MSRSLEPQQVVRLRRVMRWMRASLGSLTCQKGSGSVLSVWVLSVRMPLMARLAVLPPKVVLWRAVPWRARLEGAGEGWLVSKPTAGGAMPVNHLGPGAKDGWCQSAGRSAALVGTRIWGAVLARRARVVTFSAVPKGSSSSTGG